MNRAKVVPISWGRPEPIEIQDYDEPKSPKLALFLGLCYGLFVGLVIGYVIAYLAWHK